MTAVGAVSRALAAEMAKPAHMRDAAYIDGLQRALRCLHDLPALIRHVRDRVPTYEPELKDLLTKALVQGCDAP